MAKNLPVAALQVLLKMSAKPSIGLHGDAFNRFLEFLLTSDELPRWVEFLDRIGDIFIKELVKNKYSMPSTLYKQSLSIVGEMLSSLEERHFLRRLLMKVGFVVEEVNAIIYDNFICEFVFLFNDQMLVLLFQKLREKVDKVGVLRPLSEQQRRSVHYVAGSILNKYLGIALRSPKSPSWQRIKDCTQTVFLEGEGVNAASLSDKRWTELVNRGKLKVCGGEATEFFVSLASLLYSLERRDGSLYLEEALKAVFESDVHLKWDALLKSKLSESDSISFLEGVTKCLGQTIGRGIRLKLQNKIPKPVASVNLRHAVLTTSTVSVK